MYENIKYFMNTMETNIQIFSNSQFGEVRVVYIDGNAWLIAKDICKALGLTNVSQALSSLDEDDKRTINPNIINCDIGISNVLNRHTVGMDIKTVIPEAGKGGRDLLLVNESGFYTLVLRSNMPEAKVFRKWVTSEVLPSIRRTGAYIARKPLSVSEQLLYSAQLMVEYDKRLTALEEKLDGFDSPRTEAAHERLYEKFNGFDELVSVNELAKRLKQNGVEIGQNRLFQWLVKNHYLMISGKRWNSSKQQHENKYIPTQDAADMRLFAISRCGTVKVTEKGIDYFLSKTARL
jgi:anti-repressor protein